jgi:hypothetical protein
MYLCDLTQREPKGEVMGRAPKSYSVLGFFVAEHNGRKPQLEGVSKRDGFGKTRTA